MNDQMQLYDYFDKVVWNKPLRLCELYGGIGSQHKALTNLGVRISEHYLVEVDINATISYAAIHCDLNSHMDDEVPSDNDMIAYLQPLNFWSNEKPYDVARLPKTKLKTLYLATQLSNNLGDVFRLDDLPAVDLITWSTPCQDFSNAGLKKGFDGAKGGLTFVTLELFRKLTHKPTFLLFENVPMIVSEVFRDGFNRMLIELDTLGYENVVMKLNAKNYGIPQNRDRVFVLSIRKDYHANYSSPKPIELQLRLKDMLQTEVDSKYYLSDKMMDYMTSMENRNGFVRGDRFSVHTDDSKYAYAITTSSGNQVNDNFVITYDIAQQVTVRAYDVNTDKLKVVLRTHKNKTNKELAALLDKPLTLIEHWFRSDQSFAIPTADVWYKLKSILNIDTNEFDKSITTFEQKNNVFEKSNRVYDTDGIAPTITSTNADEKIYTTNAINKLTNNSVGVIVASGQKNAFVGSLNDVSPTLTNSMGRGGYSKPFIIPFGSFDTYENNSTIRKLTPLETWRLMGFTDTDFAKAKQHHSDSALYKQAGNSIVVQVLEHILKGVFYESDTV